MIRPIAIHQITPDIAEGDGVSNGIFYTQRLLQSLGIASEVYSGGIPPALAGRVRPIKDYVSRPDQVVIYHHSIGTDLEDFLFSLAEPKVMAYHNITPAQFFPEGSLLRRYCDLGRTQLAAWRDRFIGVIADSEYNAEEVQALGYRPVHVIPLLFELERAIAADWDKGLPQRLPEGLHLLFVGRIVENKRQHLLIQMLRELERMIPEAIHLHLVGGTASQAYHDHLRELIQRHRLSERVHLPGKVSAEALYAYYRAADAFVCMSEHEGFGIPLIEAMAFDLPVIACATSNIPNTLGEGGLLFQEADPLAMAAAVKAILDEPRLRVAVREGQRRNLERFRRPRLVQQLIAFFAELGYELGHPEAPSPDEEARLDIRIEGPFDSSFSLAEVNRETALALHAQGLKVGLHSTEGPGDYPPDPAFLKDWPKIEHLWRATHAPHRADVVLRNLYPPRVNDVQGLIRGMNAYGWEESEFPPAWVDSFNRRLDLVTVMSSYVARTLIDCGVTAPIVNIGLGVDQILRHPAEPLTDDLGSGFRFLHISSALPRKGVDALLEAYALAFTAEDDVTLILKTHPNPHHHIEAELAAWQRRHPKAPRVILINRDLSEPQVRWLYEHCHALVAPSRGEGFGMPIAEAMLLGLPVITTAHSGQLDFCNDATAWLVDFRYARSRSHFNLFGSVWAEPDLNDLARQMRAIQAASPEQRQPRIQAAQALIRQRFTWAATAQRLRQAIATFRASPILPASPRVGWVSTYNSRCGIAEYSRHLLEHWPDAHLRIYANRDAEPLSPDPAQLRRVWTTRAADEDLTDLEQAILEDGIEVLILQFNFSFFALPALGQLLRRLHERGIRLALTLHSTADVMVGDETLSLASIAQELALCERLYVHGIDDLNRLKDLGLVHQVTRLPHGAPSPLNDQAPIEDDLIATFGFLLPHKGLAELVEAIALLRRRGTRLRLLMLNSLHPDPISSTEHQRLQQRIHTLGLSDAVELITDHLPEEVILQRLARARLIIFPYQHTQESSSAAIRLGLATGRPVLCTPLPIFADLEDAVTRLPDSSPQAMAQGIEEHLKQPSNPHAQTALRQAEWLATHAWPRVTRRIVAWTQQEKLATQQGGD